MTDHGSLFRFFRRKRVVVEQHVELRGDVRLEALQRLTRIQTQPPGVDEAALIRKVTDGS